MASRGVPKTRIIHQANLNFKLATPYLDFLIAKGYMSQDRPEEDGVTIYELTELGEQLLGLLRLVEMRLEGLFNHDDELIRGILT